LELHIDEETDSKTLLGSYVATDIPGEFVWMAGPLTSAARLGRWVLIEDVDRCPEEIQASLIRLLEERILPLGVAKEEKCHPRFRLFGTCVTNANAFSEGNVHNARRKSVVSAGSNGKRVLHPNYWRKVHVDPLPFSELQIVGRQLHPLLPNSVADAVLDVLRKLDRSGRNDAVVKVEDLMDDMEQNQSSMDKSIKDILGHGARHVSVRDYIKLLSRISTALDFEPGTEYATESQRLIFLAETVDVFAMSCPHVDKRRDFICQIAAPIWGLTADAATRYVESRIPSVTFGGRNNRRVEVGRARLMAVKDEDEGLDGDMTPGKRRNFAETNHALRFMESIAVCASANEPALLVGETGE
jgi:midasin